MTASGPPGGAEQAAVRRWLRLAGPLLLAMASVASLAVACSPTGTATPPTTPTSGPDASGSPGPKPTTWPTLTIEAAVALGAADNDFTTMADDVVAAVGSEDPEQILAVMDKTLLFLTENQKNVPRLQAYDATKGVGDRLAAAYATMIEGATKIRDGLLAGDGNALETGLTTFVDGNAAYVAISPDLGDIAEQALFMKRLLVR